MSQFRIGRGPFLKAHAYALAIFADKDDARAFERVLKCITDSLGWRRRIGFKFPDGSDVDARRRGELPRRPIEKPAGGTALGR